MRADAAQTSIRSLQVNRIRRSQEAYLAISAWYLGALQYLWENTAVSA